MSTVQRSTSLFLASLLVLAGLAAACGNDDGADDDVDTHAGDWPAFFCLHELIAVSDAIVVATLHDEQIETVEVPAEEGDTGAETVTEILRSFQVQDSLAGGLAPGDYITTFSTASVVHKPHDRSRTTEVVFQVLRLEPGDTVLLFIAVVPIPDYYPDEWGTLAWAAPGEPHTARIAENGTLQWETTGRYDAQLAARDLDPGHGGAGEAFDTTIDEVRVLISDLFQPAPEEPDPASAD